MSHGNILTVGRSLPSPRSVPFLADWNETHVHSPTWPPHAQFHNALTMRMGVGQAVTSLAILTRSRDTVEDQRHDLHGAVDPPATAPLFPAPLARLPANCGG